MKAENISAKRSLKSSTEFPSGSTSKTLRCSGSQNLWDTGLAAEKAPSIKKTGVHLEPQDYHKKMEDPDAVVIDMRNVYEAAIGRFQPPEGGAEWIDPKIRISTEFPAWLEKEETKEKLKGKQVMFYCTGGVRCERATALLKNTYEEGTVQEVFQLQGGIHKYLDHFEDGGHWVGKNYVFDKRFAHGPKKPKPNEAIFGKCACCSKPWDRYRGKKKCSACGVPLLVCSACQAAKLDKNKKNPPKCPLCTEQGWETKKEKVPTAWPLV
eukprot:TRINITY_DN3704_c0_g2_i1.p1 TRINITY_DN3704_c0_g2~~TRINITY_DN3704_c0_g2_i1.p1  ORF type:complete len:267 (-),score=58.34 TRINITY_DN3704_c0_g2_i1:27-827(-)